MTDLRAEPMSARTAVIWSVLRRELDDRRGPTGRELDDRRGSAGRTAVSVLDVGGGSGGFAVPLARLGHHVTVVDPSPDALATLARRAAAGGVAELVTAVQGDADTLADLVPDASADLTLCHSVLEVVDDPERTLAAVARTLRPGGCLSVLAANRAAAVLARAVSGQFAAARAVLTDPAGRWGVADGAARRFDHDTLRRMLSAAGLQVEQVHGVRVVADLVPGAFVDGAGDALLELELELELAGRAPYRDIATQLHLLARSG